MAISTTTWTLGQLAELLQGTLEGPAEQKVSLLVPADSDSSEGICFAESEEYLLKAERSAVGAVIIGAQTRAVSKPAIRVAIPRLAFFKLLHAVRRDPPIEPGIHELACVHPDAAIDPTASIGPFAVVERGATIGPAAKVYPQCYVGENCTIGEGTCLFPGSILVQDVVLGDRCLVHSGAVIGAEGFGFQWDGNRHVKIPQVGGVVVGNDVEIGAGTCIDRAMCGDTTIGEGSKLDNLIQIGHNGRIGRHVVIAGACGIAGSVTIGDRCTIAGGVGMRDHITITNDVVLGGRSGVADDIKEPGTYFGTPPLPARDGMRVMLHMSKLPEYAARIRDLEKRIAELEK